LIYLVVQVGQLFAGDGVGKNLQLLWNKNIASGVGSSQLSTPEIFVIKRIRDHGSISPKVGHVVERRLCQHGCDALNILDTCAVDDVDLLGSWWWKVQEAASFGIYGAIA
jgi:hypothetical protein